MTEPREDILDQIESLARSARGHHRDADAYVSSSDHFRKAVTPNVVLSMIAEIRESRKPSLANTVREAVNAERQRCANIVLHRMPKDGVQDATLWLQLAIDMCAPASEAGV